MAIKMLHLNLGLLFLSPINAIQCDTNVSISSHGTIGEATDPSIDFLFVAIECSFNLPQRHRTESH
jgi:hypothetical protein